MKKLLAVVAVLGLLAGFMGCSKEEPKATPTKEAPAEEAPADEAPAEAD